jgi:hypothetical protein
VPGASHATGVKMVPVKVDDVIRSEKGEDLLLNKGPKFCLQKFLADGMGRLKTDT